MMRTHTHTTYTRIITANRLRPELDVVGEYIQILCTTCGEILSEVKIKDSNPKTK